MKRTYNRADLEFAACIGAITISAAISTWLGLLLVSFLMTLAGSLL
jgi:hypothetical protein